MLLVTFLSISSINKIISNNEQIVELGNVSLLFTEKISDHLAYVNKLLIAIVDTNVATLEIQTDSHLCAFGKWYYSEERRNTEKAYPELASILQEVEEPHQKLHQSVAKMKGSTDPATIKTFFET